MTNPYAVATSAYKDHAVNTASPARVVVMAYERLVLDCERALACFEIKRPAGEHLMHAQDLILALQTNLNVDQWEGAKRLSSLYTFVYQELIAANILQDAGKVQVCLDLLTPLADAWIQAERSIGDQPANAGTFAVA
ncbi:MAG: flagellar export chaperone FliS [Actinomycetes bacterium]|jgi:flagellar protein FliS